MSTDQGRIDLIGDSTHVLQNNIIYNYKRSLVLSVWIYA